MGLFDRFKKNNTGEWTDAYRATPRFYNKPDGQIFGAAALTEGTKTVLPKDPERKYTQNGSRIHEWKLIFISTTKQEIIGDCIYAEALKRAEKYAIAETADDILLRSLTLEEMIGILQSQK